MCKIPIHLNTWDTLWNVNSLTNFTFWNIYQASRLFFGERDVAGMFATLEPLHAMLDKGPQTLKETSFVQAYGNDLTEAQKYCKQYKVSNNIRHLNQAWDLYYHVFRRITRQLPQLTQLELQYVSPKLLMCRDLELAIPGSYLPNRDICRIASFNPSLQVSTAVYSATKFYYFPGARNFLQENLSQRVYFGEIWGVFEKY